MTYICNIGLLLKGDNRTAKSRVVKLALNEIYGGKSWKTIPFFESSCVSVTRN